MGKNKKLLYLLLILNLIFGHVAIVSAQLQSFDFSGNNAESYQCFDKVSGENLTDEDTEPSGVKLNVQGPDSFGNFYCCSGTNSGYTPVGFDCEAGQTKIIAQLKPPALQQIEVWFVRILYAIWGLVASLSFLFLVKLGYEYIISRGDPTKITEVRKKIVNYIIGFALVFLAVPILTTVFRLLGINTNAQCYNVNMPGFQFFYSSLCTDPKGVIAARFASNPCTAFEDGSDPEGVICKGTGYEGVTRGCGVIRGIYNISLTCDVQTGDTAATWCKTRELTLPWLGLVYCDSSCNPTRCYK